MNSYKKQLKITIERNLISQIFFIQRKYLRRGDVEPVKLHFAFSFSFRLSDLRYQQSSHQQRKFIYRLKGQTLAAVEKISST